VLLSYYQGAVERPAPLHVHRLRPDWQKGDTKFLPPGNNYKKGIKLLK
jgi:hypothetical protein